MVSIAIQYPDEKRFRGRCPKVEKISRHCWHRVNPLEGRNVNWLHFAIQLTYIFNFWHSGTLSARVPECQKLKM